LAADELKRAFDFVSNKELDQGRINKLNDTLGCWFGVVFFIVLVVAFITSLLAYLATLRAFG
jgi:hypothetical protein